MYAYAGPARQRRSLGARPALHLQGRLTGPRRCLARRPGGRDPRRRRPARQRQDHPAALSVRTGPGPARRDLVQQRAGPHDGPDDPGTAAPRPLRLDRPGPGPRPRAQRLGERRAPADAPRHQPPARQDRRPGVAGAPRHRRQDPQAPARTAPGGAPTGLHRQGVGAGTDGAVRGRADGPAAPHGPGPCTAHPDHGGPLARHHRGPGDPRRGHGGAGRPHGLAPGRPPGEHGPPPPVAESEGRAACSLSV